MQPDSPWKIVPPLLIVWLVFAIALAALRLHTYAEPLESDITFYAVIGHEFLSGRELYSEIWFHKPPGIHLTYAVAELLTGYGRQSIYAVSVCFALITLGGVLAAAARMGGLSGAIWGGLMWVAISGDPDLQANQPNTEVCMNSCLIWTFALFVWTNNRPMSWKETLAAGVLTAWASLYKHVAVLPVAGMAAYRILRPVGDARRTGTIIRMVVLFAIVAAAWAGMLICFAAAGRWGDAVDALFVFNTYYAGDLGRTLTLALQPGHLVVPAVAFAPGVLAVVVRRRLTAEQRQLWGYYAATCGGAYVAVVLPGSFFAHYFQLLLPWIAVAAGWLPSLLPTVLPGKSVKAGHVVTALVVVGVLGYEVSFLRLSPQQWSRRKYGPQFIQLSEQAQEIDRLLQPDETFYEFGQGAGLFFETRRRPPSGVFFYDALLNGPFQQKLSQRVLDDLQNDPPELLVIPRHSLHYFMNPDAYQARDLLVYLAENYRPLAGNDGRPAFQLFARNGWRSEATGAETSRDGP